MTKEERENEIKERILELQEEINELNEQKEAIENNEQDKIDEYDELIDDITGLIKIGSLEYTASHVLKNIDEIAYNCGYNDYFDEQLSKLENSIDDLTKELNELEQELKDLKSGNI